MLIVDDNATNLNIVRRQIAALGVAVDTACNGFVALEKLRAATGAARFDLAVVDMKMPGMSGVELALAIRADARIEAPRMVMLTSMMPSDGVRAARDAGILAYLTKPVRRAELVRTLGELIAGPRAAVAPRPARASVPYRGRVLLAEDNPVNKTVAVSMLSSWAT